MAANGALIALDFDGVVCDSVGESSLSAFKGAARQWPDIFESPKALERKQELVDKMRAVRPVVETGYENIVQIRCLYEGVSVDEMLENWSTLLPEYMAKWGLDRGELVKLFGAVRDEWIAADLDGWLAPNRIYEGVAAALQAAIKENHVYIVTTKQAHYTDLLLQRMAGVALPAERIFSQTVSGQPKSDVLEALQARHAGAARFIFVEDKLGTLEKVAKVPACAAWELFLVDWGYNTANERERAARNERIRVLNKQEFAQLLGA